MWKYFFGTLFLVGFLGVWFWLDQKSQDNQPIAFENDTPPVFQEDTSSMIEPVPALPVEPAKPVIRDIAHVVPFTSQAPTGEWGLSAFQDGCEETSAMMVWMAQEGKYLSREEAKAKLLDMALFQTKIIGHGVDTNTSDTNEYLLKEYFRITDGEVVYDFTLDELKEAVMKGIVIVPTNGRALKNPNFTAPGPLQHMLVIKGYDVTAKEFITNDPGTRMGAGYRYPEQVLYDAIREYPTGKHLPITTERKAMILISFTTED